MQTLICTKSKAKKVIPIQARLHPKEVEAPRIFRKSALESGKEMSAFCTGRLYPPGKIPDIYFC
jgi:hypothetical protein